MRFRLVAAAAAAVATPAWAQPVAQAPGYCGPMWDNWGWTMMGPIPMFLFFGMLIVVVVLAVRWISPGTSRASALDLLSERYARGEIDKAEYDQKKQDLKG